MPASLRVLFFPLLQLDHMIVQAEPRVDRLLIPRIPSLLGHDAEAEFLAADAFGQGLGAEVVWGEELGEVRAAGGAEDGAEGHVVTEPVGHVGEAADDVCD